ncbi:MAG: hypothetical protein ACLQO1_02840 [Steroidobacteraceae bacterium]|jgi:hypothetical protein
MVTLPLWGGPVRLRENGVNLLLLQIADWTLNSPPARNLSHLTGLSNRGRVLPGGEVEQRT